MFPIPTPDRLIGRRPSSRRPGADASPHSLLSDFAEGIYYLGLFGVLAGAALLAFSLAANLSFWLALVAAAAVIVGIAKLMRATASWPCSRAVATGLVETAFYVSFACQLRARGSDDHVFDPIWLLIAFVAGLFFWTTYMMWRRTRG